MISLLDFYKLRGRIEGLEKDNVSLKERLTAVEGAVLIPEQPDDKPKGKKVA